MTTFNCGIYTKNVWWKTKTKYFEIRLATLFSSELQTLTEMAANSNARTTHSSSSATFYSWPCLSHASGPPIHKTELAAFGPRPRNWNLNVFLYFFQSQILNECVLELFKFLNPIGSVTYNFCFFKTYNFCFFKTFCILLTWLAAKGHWKTPKRSNFWWTPFPPKIHPNRQKIVPNPGISSEFFYFLIGESI